MNIAVFIKQVPDTNDVKWTENNNIDRAKTDCIMNPIDRYAIEAALGIKERTNAYITAVTMGPEKAKDILKEAVATGVDNAFLLCDSKFAGSDTLATSKVLSAAIKELLPETDLIIFGQTASDGETGQTGPCVAARLNLPCISNVCEIPEVSDNFIIVNSETEKEKITYTIQTPAVICINNYIFKPRIPRIQGYINSQKLNYRTYNLYDINIQETDTGIKGSPTRVFKVFRHEDTRNGIIFSSDETDFKQIYQEIKKVI